MPNYDRSSSPSFLYPTADYGNFYGASPPSPSPKTVGFPAIPVTMISRPMTNNEHWALYYFECHAIECLTCNDPYDLHKKGLRMCSEGDRLSAAVLAYVSSKANGTQVFSTGDPEGTVRVEVPHDYEQVRLLLKSVERSQRKRRQLRRSDKKEAPVESFDSNYYVAPRRRHSTKEEKPSKSSSQHKKHESSRKDRSPVVINWPKSDPAPVILKHADTTPAYETAEEPARRFKPVSHSDKRERRQSLSDYRTEFREPTVKPTPREAARSRRAPVVLR